MAKKNPHKFYDQVFNQDLTKHKVVNKKKKEVTQAGGVKKKRVKDIKSTVEKRPHLFIMEKLKNKIAQKLQEKIGEELGGNIFAALKAQSIQL